MILSKISHFVSFHDSRFKSEVSKKGTARYELWKDVHTPDIYTIETSLAGYEQEDVSAISGGVITLLVTADR